MATNLLNLTSGKPAGDKAVGGLNRKRGVPATEVAGRGKGGFPALNPAARLALIFAVPAVMLAALALPALLGSSSSVPAPEPMQPATTITFDAPPPAASIVGAPTPDANADGGSPASEANAGSNASVSNGGSANNSGSTPGAVPTGQKTYTVAPNDLLEKIARKVYGSSHGNKWKDIAKANGISDPSRLQVGQVLIIPALEGVNPPTTASNGSNDAAPASGSSGPAGPTGPFIGFGGSEQSNAGTGLLTPAEPETRVVSKEVVPEQMHTVQPGDNPYRLASRYYNDVSQHNAIRKANPDVDWMRVNPGDSIKIPALVREIEEPVARGISPLGGAPLGGNPPALPAAGDYTVQPGDTLTGISRSYYGTASRVDDIVKANGLRNANSIRPGQVLKMPAR